MNILHLHHPWAPEIWHDLGAAKNILDCDGFLWVIKYSNGNQIFQEKKEKSEEGVTKNQ